MTVWPSSNDLVGTVVRQASGLGTSRPQASARSLMIDVWWVIVFRDEMVEMGVTASAIWQHGRVTLIEGTIQPLSAPLLEVTVIVHGTEAECQDICHVYVDDALTNT